MRSGLGLDMFSDQSHRTECKMGKKERSRISPSLCNFLQFTQLDLVILFLYTIEHKASFLYIYHSSYPGVIISNYIPPSTWKFLLEGKCYLFFMPLFPIPTPWTIKACLMNKPVNESLWNEATCATHLLWGGITVPNLHIRSTTQ